MIVQGGFQTGFCEVFATRGIADWLHGSILSTPPSFLATANTTINAPKPQGSASSSFTAGPKSLTGSGSQQTRGSFPWRVSRMHCKHEPEYPEDGRMIGVTQDIDADSLREIGEQLHALYSRRPFGRVLEIEIDAILFQAYARHQHRLKRRTEEFRWHHLGSQDVREKRLI